MDVAAIEGPYAPQINPFFSNNGVPLGQFPLSVGFASQGKTDSFSIVVRLFRGTTQVVNPSIVVSRAVTDIHFVDQQTKMFVLPMLKACACQGSTCPSPGINPDCDNLDKSPGGAVRSGGRAAELGEARPDDHRRRRRRRANDRALVALRHRRGVRLSFFQVAVSRASRGSG